MYALVLLSAAAVGIDAGWQPLEGGGVEYIIQIEPSLVDWLARGNEITSDVPPDIGTVRSYRIQVGTDELPRVAATSEVPETDGFADGTDDDRRQDVPEAATVSTFNDPELDVIDATGADDTEAPAMQPWEDEPQEFVSPDDARPIEVGTSDYRTDRRAAPASATEYPYAEIDAAEGDRADEEALDPKEAEPETARPWWPLTAALLGLFVSVGGNVYLGWVNVSQRSRYQKLVERFTGRVKVNASKDS